MSKEKAIRVGDCQVSPVVPAETHSVLAEVYQLLEDYAPVWYSSKIRIRLQTELRATEEPAAPATPSLRLVCGDR
jgi:hypothetical protein